MIFNCLNSEYNLFEVFKHEVDIDVKETIEDVEHILNNELFENLAEATDSAAINGNLFTDYNFFIHFSVSNKHKAGIIRSVEAQNGKILEELNEQITHVVVDKM